MELLEKSAQYLFDSIIFDDYVNSYFSFVRDFLFESFLFFLLNVEIDTKVLVNISTSTC